MVNDIEENLHRMPNHGIAIQHKHVNCSPYQTKDFYDGVRHELPNALI